MTDKRRQKSFTLLELLIVIAIIVILVAIIVPVISGRTRKASEAVCYYNMSVVERVYTYYWMLDMIDNGSANPLVVLEGEIKKTCPKATLSGTSITGVCPSGGKYECVLDDAVMHITCSKHGAPEDDVQTNLASVYGVLSSNNKINTWLKSNVSRKELAINSAAAVRANSYAKELDILLKEKGLNTDEHSYRVLIKMNCDLINPKNGEYIIDWADKRMTDEDVGTQIDVTRYDVGSKTYTRGKSTVVKQKDGNGDTILQLINFKPV